jgi:HTH-type transcriptional regulator/antitoxin HigA
MGRSQKELAKLLGSRSQASDLLKGRRKVSLEVAQKISAAWQIPIQLLVAPYKPGEAAA